MDLSAVIDEIVSRADDFLAGAADRKEAAAGIAELLNSDYPKLSPGERKKVTEGVLSILEDEGFFEAGPAGGASGEDGESSNGE